jgi:hypothetical protein
MYKLLHRVLSTDYIPSCFHYRATGLARVEKLTQDPIENDKLNILTFRDHMPADEKSDRVLIDLRGQDRK